MGAILLLAFIVVPVVEITVIGQVQEALGWPITLAILILDSVIGAVLVRRQGALAWRRFQEALGSARMPAEEVIDGAMILFGGALMLTPGFVTDIVGLALVFPLSRRLLNAAVRRRVSVAAGTTAFGVGGSGLGASMFSLGSRRSRPSEEQGTSADPIRPGAASPNAPPGVVDVEVVEIRRNPPSGDDSPTSGEPT